MRREYDRVKLHCTLVNTLFRREEGDMGDTQGREARVTFDARPLLHGWKDFELGQVVLLLCCAVLV